MIVAAVRLGANAVIAIGSADHVGGIVCQSSMRGTAVLAEPVE